MEINKQSQEAGSYSTQMQATTIVNNYNTVGVTEQQVKDICERQFQIAMQNWTAVANEIASRRIEDFESKLIPKFRAQDKTFSAFADPSFQILIRKAQISAACSESESNHDLLADLILQRIEHPHDRRGNLGIDKAIEIANQVEFTPLVALSLVIAITRFSPISSTINGALSVLEELYGKILGEIILPTGEEWLEHLDLLSTIRMGTQGFNSFKKLEEFLPERLNEYFTVGLKEDSEELLTLKTDFNKVGLPNSCFVPHGFKLGYVMLNPIARQTDVCIMVTFHGVLVKMQLNNSQKKIIEKAVKTMCGLDLNEVAKESFMEKWNQHSTLRKVSAWWNALPVHFNPTSVGVALANAYIHGKMPTAPCLC